MQSEGRPNEYIVTKSMCSSEVVQGTWRIRAWPSRKDHASLLEEMALKLKRSQEAFGGGMN